MRTGTRLTRSPVLPLAAMVLAMAGCSGTAGGSGSITPSSMRSPKGPTDRAEVTPSATPTAEPGSPSAVPSEAAALPKGLTEKDVAAGVLSAEVRWEASGTLRTVPGTARAPAGKGAVLKVRVQVEKGLAVNPGNFADFVLATLNDRRSWTENGTRRFARTDRAAQAFTTVTLASPQTSAQLCRPLRTMGKLSCRNGDRVVLTNYRWVRAIPEYQRDREGYRQYVVNHEVGHALGHGHEYCAGKGKVAPLMMQQTKGLLGCRPNPWPHP